MRDKKVNTCEKKLSIIIPHYNSPKLLERMLESIPNHEEIEVIIVDDRSDSEVIEYKECKKRYSGRNIYFFDNDLPGKGAGTCRNIGTTKAVGKWLLFADADDCFVDDFCDKLAPFLNSGADIVYFVPTSIELDTNKEALRHIETKELVNNYLHKSNKKNELYLRYRFVQPWSKLIKRQLVLDHGLAFEEIVVGNDCMFSMKAAFCAKEIAASSEVIYCITRRDGSLTTLISYEIFKVRLEVFIRRYLFLKEHLSKQEFKLLNLHGRGYVWRAILMRYSLIEIFEVYRTLRKNKVHLLNKELFNIYLSAKRFFHSVKKIKRDKYW